MFFNCYGLQFKWLLMFIVQFDLLGPRKTKCCYWGCPKVDSLDRFWGQFWHILMDQHQLKWGQSSMLLTHGRDPTFTYAFGSICEWKYKYEREKLCVPTSDWLRSDSWAGRNTRDSLNSDGNDSAMSRFNSEAERRRDEEQQREERDKRWCVDLRRI